MFGKLSLVENKDGTYDLIIQYSRSHGEFSLDFMSRQGMSTGYRSVADYLNRFAGGMKVRSAKIMVGGLVVLALPIASMLRASATSPRYSMTYLYTGSQNQQVADVAAAQSALDTVSPNYFDIDSSGGLIFNRPATGTLEELRSMGMRVVPFLSNHWNRQAGILALENTEKMTDELATHIEEYDLDGINVDIENLTPAQRDGYVEFVAMLREKIPEQKEVSVAVAANPHSLDTGWHGSYDYAGLGKYADYLMLMTYDEHYLGSEPGPVAGIDFVEDSIRYALRHVGADQVVAGLPFFGRIWGGDGYFQGDEVPLNQAEELIRLYDAQVLYDENVQSPVAAFTIRDDDPKPDIHGRTLRAGDYQLWFENDASILAKLALVDDYSLKGTASWELGLQSDEVWQAFEGWINRYGYAPEETEEEPVEEETAPEIPSGITPPVVTPAATLKRTGVIRTESTALRSSAGAEHAATATLNLGSEVRLISASGDWYRVSTASGKTGYLPKENVTLHRAGVITWPGTKVMSGLGADSRVVAAPAAGTAVTVLETLKGGWRRVRLPDGKTGLVAGRQISNSPYNQEINIKTTRVALRLRTTAAADAASLGTVPAGEKLLLLGEENGYQKISYGAVTAFISPGCLQ